MASQRQIEANKRNRAKRRGVSPEGREQLRRAAFRNRPWEHSTGPRTEFGKRRSRENAVFSGEHCRTVEPFASIDRLRRLLARQAYRQARLAWVSQRLLALSRGVLWAMESGGAGSGSRGDSSSVAADVGECKQLLAESRELVSVMKEEALLKPQAWEAVAGSLGIPFGAVASSPEERQAGLSKDRAGGEEDTRGDDPTDASCPLGFSTDLALIARFTQHLAARPATLGGMALARVFTPLVERVLWVNVALAGQMDRTCRETARG